MPHLAPVPLSEVQDEDIRQRFEHYRNTRGFTPNSIMTMVRRLALKAAKQPNEATQADFDALKEHFDDGQIVEIVASIALFGYLNRWNDTMATELEPLAVEVAERTIGPVGWEPGKHG